MDKQLQRFPGILTVGGLVMFLLGVTISVVLPLGAIINDGGDTASLETLAAHPAGSGFEELANLYPDEFENYWPEGPTPANYAIALERGRDLYIENACFQCHTQQVRPFGHETARYGNQSTMTEQNNDLQKPNLFGIHRVGPDLARARDVRATQYLVQYFWDPDVLVPGSAMPSYRWLYDEEGVLNEDGFALISYVQWLGDYQPVAASDNTEPSGEQ